MMDCKSPKTKTAAGLIKRTSPMLDEIESKTVHKAEEGDRQRKKKTMSEVKPVENINKNLQSFPEIRPVQKEVLLSQTARPCI